MDPSLKKVAQSLSDGYSGTAVPTPGPIIAFLLQLLAMFGCAIPVAKTYADRYPLLTKRRIRLNAMLEIDQTGETEIDVSRAVQACYGTVTTSSVEDLTQAKAALPTETA